jgi:hypothetical protein
MLAIRAAWRAPFWITFFNLAMASLGSIRQFSSRNAKGIVLRMAQKAAYCGVKPLHNHHRTMSRGIRKKALTLRVSAQFGI